MTSDHPFQQKDAANTRSPYTVHLALIVSTLLCESDANVDNSNSLNTLNIDHFLHFPPHHALLSSQLPSLPSIQVISR